MRKRDEKRPIPARASNTSAHSGHSVELLIALVNVMISGDQRWRSACDFGRRVQQRNRGDISDRQVGDKRLVLAHPSEVRRRNCSQPAQVAPIGCPGNGGEPPTVHDDLGAGEYEGQSLAGRVERVAGRSESRPEKRMDFFGRYVNGENIGIQGRSALAVARRWNLPG